jgi:hypothetical protein
VEILARKATRPRNKSIRNKPLTTVNDIGSTQFRYQQDKILIYLAHNQ